MKLRPLADRVVVYPKQTTFDPSGMPAVRLSGPWSQRSSILRTELLKSLILAVVAFSAGAAIGHHVHHWVAAPVALLIGIVLGCLAQERL